MAGPLIAILDYGSGNRRSVQTALEHVGAQALVTGDRSEIERADGMVIPGVGAFPAAMGALDELGLAQAVVEFAGSGRPLLGACLGMQLLFEASDEQGGAAGLSLLEGRVERLPAEGLKLPHIGWGEVRWAKSSPLTAGLPDPSFFYHVHTFAPLPAREEDVLGISEYATSFASVVGRDNVFGVQFHPEKSSRNGLAMLGNFAGLCAGDGS